MSLNIWNLEWLNHNSQRSYPICDWATKECSESSAIKIPDDFILALSLSVNSSHKIDIDKFYIKSLLVMESGCTIILGYNDTEVASVNILKSSIQNTYLLKGVGEFDDAVGYIGINPDSRIFNDLSGYFNFELEATAIEPDCIRETSKVLSAIQVDNDGTESKRYYGDIILKAGINMNISVSNNAITFNAVKSPASNTCDCPDYSTDPLSSINNVEPDDNGNINITGAECLSISSGSNSIILKDTCSEPCGTCDELENIYDKIKDLGNDIPAISDTLQNIEERQQQIALYCGGVSTSETSCNCVKKQVEEEAEEEEESGSGETSTEEPTQYYAIFQFRVKGSNDTFSSIKKTTIEHASGTLVYKYLQYKQHPTQTSYYIATLPLDSALNTNCNGEVIYYADTHEAGRTGARTEQRHASIEINTIDYIHTMIGEWE